METECYPCIPMQSASNQKSSSVMIKNEPLSEEEEVEEEESGDGDDESGEDEDDNCFVNVVDHPLESNTSESAAIVTQQNHKIVTQLATTVHGSRPRANGTHNKKIKMPNKRSQTSIYTNYAAKTTRCNPKVHVSLLNSGNYATNRTAMETNHNTTARSSSNNNNNNNNVFCVKKQQPNISHQLISNSIAPTNTVENSVTLLSALVPHPNGGGEPSKGMPSSAGGSVAATASTTNTTTVGRIRMQQLQLQPQQLQLQKYVRLTKVST